MTVLSKLVRPSVPFPRLRSTRCRSTSSIDLGNCPLRIAVIGAGPAGFYAASRVLSLPGSEKTSIDMFELLPVPFGLVRFGVAPDHPEVKNCQHKFEELARDPRFRFFGNVQISDYTTSNHEASLVPNLSPSPYAAQIPLSNLVPHYDAILLTYGASLDRSLGIPGEEHTNVLSARSFVSWYNGHPDAASLAPLLDLSKHSNITIVGQGNVALDVARLLLKPVDELRQTDLPEYAIAELSRSRVKHVDVVGRRGPLELAATTKELREMMHLKNVGFNIDSDLLGEAKSKVGVNPKMDGARAKKRALGLLETGSKTPLATSDKSWSLSFLRSPTAFLPSIPSRDTLEPTYASEVEYEINELVDDERGVSARSTGKKEVRAADLIFKSVGYRSIGLPGLPFDAKKGIVRNENGRVTTDNGERIPGLYTSGWLARGPTGVIATTMFDAFANADIMASDSANLDGPEKPPIDIEKLAGGRQVVNWKMWERIDEEEKRRGKELGKEREKVTSVKEMLDML